MANPVEVNFVLLSDQESESNRLHRQDRRVLIHFLALKRLDKHIERKEPRPKNGALDLVGTERRVRAAHEPAEGGVDSAAGL
ncbi:hypothetical protein MTR_8g059780 [Medicago truncatula]|uniref:Uncharacterized protein n=1 Tax=Medicago truncatula TaxID=3880 RepID=G7LCV0_MEDTR|nr:hypothetical protein MTR_8g059780 [Medicago truncatula]